MRTLRGRVQRTIGQTMNLWLVIDCTLTLSVKETKKSHRKVLILLCSHNPCCFMSSPCWTYWPFDSSIIVFVCLHNVFLFWNYGNKVGMNVTYLHYTLTPSRIIVRKMPLSNKIQLKILKVTISSKIQQKVLNCVITT